MNYGGSYPCIQLPFIRFGFGKGFIEIEVYTSECVPAGCHSLSLPFEIFRKNV